MEDAEIKKGLKSLEKKKNNRIKPFYNFLNSVELRFMGPFIAMSH